MSKPNETIPPIKPDSSAQISTLRTAAAMMVAIALVGLVVWTATSGGKTQWVASSGSAPNSLFREDASGVYVVLPPNAAQTASQIAASQPTATEPMRNEATTRVTAMLMPEQKPRRTTTPPREAAPAASALVEPAHEDAAPSDSAADAPAASERQEIEPNARIPDQPKYAEPAQPEQTIDNAAAQPIQREPTYDEPMRDDRAGDEAPDDEQAYDDKESRQDAPYAPESDRDDD